MSDRAAGRQFRRTFEKVKEAALRTAAGRGHEMGGFSGVGLTASADCRRCRAQVVVDATKEVYAGTACTQTCEQRVNQGRRT
jgi:hypothetical protein